MKQGNFLTKEDKKIIAVVLGIGSYNDLGVIRSCGEVGIGSIYLTPIGIDLVFPIQKSKYIITYQKIKFTEKAIVAEIIHISQSYDAIISVFPTADITACILDRNFDKFPSSVTISHAEGKMAELMDKSTMSEQAKQAGLRIPLTIVVSTKDNQEIETINYPVIVKPLRSIDGSKSDITICQSIGELQSTRHSYAEKGYKEMLVQQYLCAPDKKEIGITGISYCDGTVEIHGYIDKIRNLMSINNFGIYHPDDNSFDYEALVQYIKQTGYKGIFDTDFILNHGVLYFIECNFRNGAYGYCTTASGFNMPARWTIGKQSALITPLRDIVFMDERTDFLNVKWGHISFLRWIKDFLRSDILLFWNRKDPKPYFRIPAMAKLLVEKAGRCLIKILPSPLAR